MTRLGEQKHGIRSRRPKTIETSRRTVRVVAPKTLPENYEFDILVEGQTYTASVPKGGVQEGEEFEVPHPEDWDEERSESLTAKPTEEEDDDEGNNDDGESQTQLKQNKADNKEEKCEDISQQDSQKGQEEKKQKDRDDLGAPYGRWRYPLCACCDVVTQATFWMALCCVPVLIAQLVTRMKLNFAGKRDTNLEVSLSYNKIILTFLVVLAMANVVQVGVILIPLFIVVLLVYTGRNLRKNIRKRYNIPSSLPEPVDDCCCLLFCCCCTSIQMSRQTHNDKEYPGSCCTPTGLDMDAPEMTV